MSVQQASGWSGLRGHTAQREHFEGILAAGRLGHAYLLVGPEGIGKRRFARCLAACLLCPETDPEILEACDKCRSCKQIAAGSHPDLLEVGLPEGKNVVPISLLIGDHESRGRAGLCYELSLSPMENTRETRHRTQARRGRRELPPRHARRAPLRPPDLPGGRRMRLPDPLCRASV